MAQKNIFSAVSTVSLILIFVKIIGFVKQAVIAAYFGTSGETDIFLLVSEFMENMGVAVFSAISISFLSLYLDTLHNKGKEEVDKLTSNTAAVFLPFVFLIMIICVIFPEQIAAIIAPGYGSIQKGIVAKYIVLFSVTFLNMFICYICTAILEAEKHFIPGKLVGVIKSICMIFACLFFSKKWGIDALVLSILMYYILESIYLITCAKKFFKIRVEKPWRDKRVVQLLKLSIPLFISNGGVQLQSIVDKAVGSSLPEGAIATLSFSHYLMSTVHSIIVGSICTVLFSYFSTYAAKEEFENLVAALYKYIKITIIILLPIIIMFIGYSYDIIDVVYGRGAFDSTAISNTAVALSAYSIGLLFIGIRDLMVRAHYAYQDTKTVMVNGIIGVFINIILSITLSKFMGFAGIALATSISSLCVAVMSCNTIKRHISQFRIFSLWRFFVIAGIAGVVGVGAIVAANIYVELGNVFVELILKGMICMAAYVIMLNILRCDEVLNFEKMILKKLKFDR